MTSVQILKDWRIQNKKTQKQIAYMLNVSESSVSAWEAQREYPNLINAIKINRFLEARNMKVVVHYVTKRKIGLLNRFFMWFLKVRTV